MKKILIVEDEEVLLSVLTDNLTKEGFQVLKARNGRDGLATALSDHPDVILLDILMPVMDGITMLKKLHEDAWGGNAKVIMLTNLTDNKKVVEAMESGSYNYLVKSDWTMGDVIAKVNSILAQ